MAGHDGEVPLPLRVRAATAVEAEDVAALVHSAYRSDESRQGWTTEADLVGGQRVDAAMVRSFVAADGNVVLVAVLDEAALDEAALDEAGARDDAPGGPAPVVACCHLQRRARGAYLGMFAVRPGLQGRGVGRAVLAAAEQHVRDRWGLGTVEITVLDHRPELLAWYERCGFRPTGERHAFPADAERFGVPRRPDLQLLGMTKHLVVPGRSGSGT